MQHIAIKQEEKDGQIVYIVNAIPLKNKNKSIVQRIPHPLGSDFLEFQTLDEAKDAIIRAGFSYILPDGKKGAETNKINTKIPVGNFETLIFETIKSKINSTNSSISAAAVLALAEFQNDEAFDILFNKIAEENDVVRKNAISGICRYAKLLQDRIIDTLSSDNWIAKNSALTCISSCIEDKNIDLEKFIRPLIKTCEDVNPIVQANAISTLAIVYHWYKKNISG